MLITREMLNSPEMLGMRRLPTAAAFYHFNSVEDAKKVKKEFSPAVTVLDGNWKFCYTDSPEKLGKDIVSPKHDTSDWKDVVVPDCWSMHEKADPPHYTNIKMPFDAPIPEIPEKNPTGIYRRTFEFNRSGKAVSAILHFDGAESFFAVYVNGKFAGCSKDSRGSTEFDITGLVQNGTNHLAVIVVKWSDATWIEDQDHWYLPGLSRSVALYTIPRYRVNDIDCQTTLDDTYTTGIIDGEVLVSVPAKDRKCPKVNVKLFSPDDKCVWQGTASPKVRFTGSGDWWFDHSDEERTAFVFHAKISGVQKWSAETPNLYTVIIEYKSSNSTLRDISSVRVGFRRYEIKSRELLINGKAVLICGVNRHDHHEYKGKAVPYETMKRDVELMKQFNINPFHTISILWTSLPVFICACDLSIST